MLGPFRASDRNGPLALGGRQQQLVLAILVANANRMVSTERLIDEIWGEAPPEAARKVVQSYSARLRRALNQDEEILKGQASGYVLEVGPDQVDAHRFENLVDRARAGLHDDPANAAQILEQALELWRGPLYGDLADDAPSLREEAARLEELHLAALEARFEANLRSGEDTSFVPELERAVAAHPYRERLRSLLMLSLYRSGRQADALSAYQEARRLLAEDLGLEPSPELRRLEQAVLDQDPALQSADPLGSLFVPEEAGPRRNPFKGLRPFMEEDSEDFFGRANLVRRLTERLGGRDVSGRLVVVAGPSGSGKSSVVRAGLIPALRQGALPGADDWRVETLYPGEDPLGALRKAIGDPARGEEQDLFDLIAALEDRLLLVIDQFEEIFTLSDDDQTRRTFLNWIATVAADGGGGLRVVVTIRADFLDRLLQYTELAHLVQPCLELVPPLAEHEVRAAVIEPAARVGVRADPELVAEMTQHAAARPGALPLLQYALTDLFERRTGDRLTLDAYRATGEISGALARRAEDLYRGLDELGREAVRQSCLRLVVLTDEGEQLRRRVATAELTRLPLDADALDRVLEIFGRHRLLTFDRDPSTGDPVVEIAHEALLREWPRLEDWVEEAREGLLLQRRLESALAEWREAGEDSSYLVGGGRLDQFETWLAGTDLAVTQDERDFLAASRALVDRRHRQQNVRRWSIVGVLALAVVAAFAVAVWMRDRERTATARELAAASRVPANTDPQLSLLLALEAVRADDTREAVEALHRAVVSSREIWQVTFPDDQILGQSSGVAISPDDRLVATTFDGIHVLLRDRETGGLLRTMEPATPIEVGFTPGGPGIAFSPDGQVVASFGSDGLIRIWEVDTGAQLTELVAAEVDLQLGRGVVFGPEGKWLYTVAASPPLGPLPVIQWNTETWTEERRWEVEGIVAGGVAVNTDGSLIAVPLWDAREVIMFDTETGVEVNRIAVEGDNRVNAVAFSSQGFIAVAAGGHITLWDPITGEQLPSEFTAGVLSDVIYLQFDPGGCRLATGLLGEGTIGVWELAHPCRAFEEVPRPMNLLGHTTTSGTVAFDSTGRTLVSGSGDGTVRLWDVSLVGRGEVASFQSRFPMDVSYFDGGGWLAVATLGDQHGMTLIDLTDLEQIRIPEAYSTRLALSPHGTRFAAQVAAVDDEGRQLPDPEIPGRGLFEPATGIWDTATGELLLQLPAPAETCEGTFVPGDPAAFSNDGMILAVSYHCEGVFRVWDLETQSLIVERDGAGRVLFAPDDRYLITTRDNVLLIWETDGWSLSDEISTGGGLLGEIAFSDNGELAAVGSEEGLVHIFDTSDWSLAETLTGHTGAVSRGVAFDADDRLVTAGAADRTIRIWDIATGQELWKLEGHTQPMESVAFHPNGNHVVSTSQADWAVWIWTLDVDELTEIAESRATRSLTDPECQVYLHVEACPTE